MTVSMLWVGHFCLHIIQVTWFLDYVGRLRPEPVQKDGSRAEVEFGRFGVQYGLAEGYSADIFRTRRCPANLITLHVPGFGFSKQWLGKWHDNCALFSRCLLQGDPTLYMLLSIDS